MQRSLLFMILTLNLFVLFGCVTGKHAQVVEERSVNKTDCQHLQAIADFSALAEGDPFAVESMKIHDHCLQLIISYGGGCGKTSFEAYTTGIQNNTFPPELVVGVDFHDEDPCRSIVRDTLSVDLNPYVGVARSGGLSIQLINTDHRVIFALPLH